MACYGVYFVARFCVIVLAWGRAVSCALRTSGLLLQSMCVPLHVLVVLLCVVVGVSSVFWSFLVFLSHPPLPLFHCLVFYYCYLIVYYYNFHSAPGSVLGLGLGLAGGARGWVAGRAGFWDVLATWVWGRQLQSLGSWAPDLHVRFRC